MRLRNWILPVAFLVAAPACDQSKAELDTTKGQLQQVTQDRDSLKSQLDAANQKIATLQQQLNDATAKAAAPAAPAAPAGEEKKEEHHEHHAAAKGEPVHQTKAAATAEKKVTKGASSLNQ